MQEKNPFWGIVSGISRDESRCRRSPSVDVRLEGVRVHGTRAVVALGVIAADGMQELVLLLRLHSLGDDGNAEAVGHVDDGSEHACDTRVALEVAHEDHVCLEDVDGNVAEGVEGRVPATEIVHEDGEAVILQARDHGNDEVDVLGVRGFRDLDAEQSRLDAVLLDEGDNSS